MSQLLGAYNPFDERLSSPFLDRSRNFLAAPFVSHPQARSKIDAAGGDMHKARLILFSQRFPRVAPYAFECGICMEEISALCGVELVSCQHAFCPQCLAAHAARFGH